MKQAKQWIKQVEKRMEAVGKERDNIDDMIQEMKELREHCLEAYDLLQQTRDVLSQLV